MTREEYIDLFHKAQVNLVAFKMVFHCDDELRKMVEMAIADEREACAKVCEQDENRADDWIPDSRPGGYFANAIRARGQA